MRPFGFFLLVVLVGSPASAKMQIESQWSAGEISIDGDTKDWQGSLSLIEEQALVLGVRNDETHLYLCVASGQREFGHGAVLLGLILEVGAKGSPPLEIRFPVGRAGSGAPQSLDLERLRGGAELPPELWEEALATFQVKRPGRERWETLDAKTALGIAIGAARYGSGLAYELKVPLRSSADEPYAVEADPGAKLTLSVDTPRPDRETVRRNMAARGGSSRGSPGDPSGIGGTSGRGSGMDDGMGGMSGTRDPVPQGGPVPIRVRAKVLLSSGPAAKR